MSVEREAAIAYARRRRPIFPVGRNKKPTISKEEGGRGYLDATTDETTISRWWARWPHAGIGTPTGPSWFVLDDDTNGQALAQLEVEHGPLPPTVEVVTPRPGLHLLPARRRHEQRRRAARRDARPRHRRLRAAAAKPHENGGRYEWRTAPDEIPVAPAPAWLLELLASPSNGAGCGEYRPPGERVPHGQRHPYLKDWAVRLLRGGITDVDTIEAHLCVRVRARLRAAAAAEAGRLQQARQVGGRVADRRTRALPRWSGRVHPQARERRGSDGEERKRYRRARRGAAARLAGGRDPRVPDDRVRAAGAATTSAGSFATAGARARA